MTNGTSENNPSTSTGVQIQEYHRTALDSMPATTRAEAKFHGKIMLRWSITSSLGGEDIKML